jgi:hypothetical protein
MNAMAGLVVSVGILLLGLGGCSSISPELVAELAKDNASFCFTSDIRGGAGSIAAPTGGYGQGTLSFCRSRQANAKVTLGADGSISIEHRPDTPADVE